MVRGCMDKPPSSMGAPKCDNFWRNPYIVERWWASSQTIHTPSSSAPPEAHHCQNARRSCCQENHNHRSQNVQVFRTSFTFAKSSKPNQTQRRKKEGDNNVQKGKSSPYMHHPTQLASDIQRNTTHKGDRIPHENASNIEGQVCQSNLQ